MTANGIPPPYLPPLTPKIYFTADRFSRQLFNILAHPRAHSPPQAHRLGIGVFNRTATTASGDISEFYSLSKHLSVSSLFFYLPFSAAARPPTEWRVVARICKSNKFIWIEIELAPFVHVMMSLCMFQVYYASCGDDIYDSGGRFWENEWKTSFEITLSGAAVDDVQTLWKFH